MNRLPEALLLGLLTGAALVSQPARADWFFGLFGDSDPAPAPKPGVAAYQIEIVTPKASLKDTLQASSNLYRLRHQPPDNGEGLARRAQADLPRLVDTLWAEGYYDASVRATLDGHAITMDGTGLDAAAQEANADIGRRVVRARLIVSSGQLYHIGAIRVIDARTGAPVDPDLTQPRVLKLASGDPATAGSIRAMQARLAQAVRRKSFPLAKVDLAQATVIHPEKRVDLLVTVDSGPKAGFGKVTITGTRDLDPRVVRSFIYVEPGDPYSPDKIAAMRKSMGQIEAIGSTRILESDHLDPDGNLPITVQVDERKKYAVSAAAQYSTVDGPSARADWTARNLFGGGERLRLSGVVGYSQNTTYDTVRNKSWFDPNRMLGRLNANFIKPALGGSRNDYLADVTLAREVTNSYQAQYFNVSQYIRHRFSEEFWFQAGWEIERGQSQDSFGKTNYFLSGVSVALRYDTTDNELDPHRGVRVIATGSADPKFFGSSMNFYQGKAQASTYYSIDDDGRYVLAGRVALGAGGGAYILDIPDNRRFFAGGGGSVRGYPWRSLSPLGANGEPMGGQSLFEASAEARIKITDTIGIVPFVDAGQAYATSFPNFEQYICYSVGLGLRYYTGFGPFRVDVAFPLERQSGDPSVAVYFGVGQAF
ncbi:autotransporter assembly complex protein TamA [Rhodoblastus acidophilus]|uniref:Autotransporter assembly complex protein TamA n=1 Tax=Candidatus Rhodoblastus alkanivorans TaxID=2954117 RepID=A0ABS9Z5Z5_9HYPH|nr:autotransporter assembly complex family protein [Candidatus Rhodoblastus alkanivorans]MCI4678639.1 autotransporter assembly complex protein TamA [Candidatus Rhodoblastus alkanivorans]MCI4683048.1 autotransporter assembly complex protein TamA [Candidatus Rhodoblastus alkanivorans]MDI4640359.1 autotransporter assembly complex protein TamA [Rhodoblastus acidophilus]